LNPSELADLIRSTIQRKIDQSDTITNYRQPLVGFVAADEPDFSRLGRLIGGEHLTPADLLPGARSVVSFFLPFSKDTAIANTKEPERVAREWGLAYAETNALIGVVTGRLIEVLKKAGIQAAAEPATGNYDETTLRSNWSHKSIAVLAGLGSIGLHQMVITDSGCAGRFGSLVLDAELPIKKPPPKERCEYYDTGTCLECVLRCPVQALNEHAPFDRLACWRQCRKNGTDFIDLRADVYVCGKCAVFGPCALESAV
jgi:epoxyqueuosine reductase QueG